MLIDTAPFAIATRINLRASKACATGYAGATIIKSGCRDDSPARGCRAKGIALQKEGNEGHWEAIPK
jgi:hypothetical protein